MTIPTSGASLPFQFSAEPFKRLMPISVFKPDIALSLQPFFKVPSSETILKTRVCLLFGNPVMASST
eukprot:6111439-Karenia_brevis.AAC.1